MIPPVALVTIVVVGPAPLGRRCALCGSPFVSRDRAARLYTRHAFGRVLHASSHTPICPTRASLVIATPERVLAMRRADPR